MALTSDADMETVKMLLHVKEDIDTLKMADKRHGNLLLHLAAICGCNVVVAVLLMTEYLAAAGEVNAKRQDSLVIVWKTFYIF